MKRSRLPSILLKVNISNIQQTVNNKHGTLLSLLEEYTDGGIIARTCEGDVGVAKCEGSCASQVQPSVVHPSGFLKVVSSNNLIKFGH